MAAAWGSKSNVTQNFLRSPRPSARLTLAPNGAWTMSCIPPVSSKNRSNTMSSWVGSRPQPGPAGPQIVDDKGGGHDVYAGHLLNEGDGGLPPAGVEPSGHRAPQPRDLVGQLVGAARRLAEPERDRWVLAGGISHPHHAIGHLHDLPRMAAEEEHVALGGFDGEVLVHGADEHIARLHQHPVVAGLGNRSARGEGGQPGPAPAAKPSVDSIAMEIGQAPAAPGLDSGRDQIHDLLELFGLEPPVGPGARDEAE